MFWIVGYPANDVIIAEYKKNKFKMCLQPLKKKKKFNLELHVLTCPEFKTSMSERRMATTLLTVRSGKTSLDVG